MRLGVSTDLGYKEPAQWASQMKECGCGSVVFPIDYTAAEEEIEAFAAAAEEKGLVIAEVGVWCNPLSPNEEERKKAVERCKGQLKLADQIGAKCCVNVAGSAGERWAGSYKANLLDGMWKQTVKTIQEILDDVQPVNTYYTLEPMACMFPMDPQQYLRLIESVARDRFAVHMDVFNWITSPEKYFFHEALIEESFQKLGKYIKSCHLKDVLLLEQATFQVKEVACGQGEICLEKYIELAEELNPDMPMIIEHLKSKEEYLSSLAYVKQRIEALGIVLL